MTKDHTSELIHKVNNLLAVIHTQVGVSRAAESFEVARDALEMIDRCAEETGKTVRRVREAADG